MRFSSPLASRRTGACRRRPFCLRLQLLEDRCQPNAGLLDPTFGVGGQVTTGILSPPDSNIAGTAIDSLGRIVVTGRTYNGSNWDFAVARFTSAGILDSTFGGTGVVTFSFGAFDDFAYGVAVDSLGRIVVAGSTNNSLTTGDTDFAVARLTVAGTLDSSFDGDGRRTLAFGAFTDTAYGVAVDSLDRVVVAGHTFNIGVDSDFAVARLTTAGALDTSFDGDGKQTITFGASDVANGVAVDSLDRVVVAGLIGYGPSDFDFAVARLTTAGALDASFNGDGRQVIHFVNAISRAYGVAVDSQNRIVAAGYRHDGNLDFAVVRLTPAGALDTSFDEDGKLTIAFGDFTDVANGVAIDSLDRIVVAGSTYTGSNVNFAVARLTTAGAFDTSFDADGKQTIDFGGYDPAKGAAIDSADRVVLAGGSDYNGSVAAIARLTGDTTTASAQVNDGSVQRSRVTSLTIRFSAEVTFSGQPEAAFTLVRTGGKAVSFVATVTVEYGGTVVTLSNFTGAETQFGSLRDGRYTLTALASQISAEGQALDGDGNGTPGGDFVFGDADGLFRFFGDINGDRRVDIADYGLFSLSYLNAANYVAGFDFNGDGRIDIADYGQFSLRYLAPLP